MTSVVPSEAFKKFRLQPLGARKPGAGRNVRVAEAKASRFFVRLRHD